MMRTEETEVRKSRPDAKAKLAARARAAGFDAVRVTRPDSIPEAASRLKAFLDDGRHGTMDWLETTADRRGNPQVLWPEARSVVMLAMSYAPGSDPLDALANPHIGIVSTYAKRSDYHDVMKGKLKELAAVLASDTAADVK